MSALQSTRFEDKAEKYGYVEAFDCDDERQPKTRRQHKSASDAEDEYSEVEEDKRFQFADDTEYDPNTEIDSNSAYVGEVDNSDEEVIGV